MKIQKIFNIKQATFLYKNGAKLYLDGEYSPFGLDKKEYDGVFKPFTYIEFIRDEAFEQANKLWCENS